jgi:hypothetical protein
MIYYFLVLFFDDRILFCSVFSKVNNGLSCDFMTANLWQVKALND